MESSGTLSKILRTQGLQFVRVLQGALRLFILYDEQHVQVQAVIDRADGILQPLLKEAKTLSISFQFDKVVLNSLPVSDPSLSSLATELVKRRIGFLVFSEGMTRAGLAYMLRLLATKPETIEEQGGIVQFLRANPLEHGRVVPVQVASADGSLAVVTEAEEASSIAHIPRWLLKTLEEVQRSTSSVLVGPQQLAELASGLSPDLTPQQRLLMPQLQELLVRVVQRADTNALSDLIRSASGETGAAGEELLKSVLVQALIVVSQENELSQMERIIRSTSMLEMNPEALLQMVPPGAIPEGTLHSLQAYARWLSRPLEERVAEAATGSAGTLEFRWLVLEIEYSLQQDARQPAADLLLALFSADGPPTESERAEVLSRARHLLAQLCAGGLPTNSAKMLETLAARLRGENAPTVATPLIDMVVTLAQTAAERGDLPASGAAAAVVGEIAAEFSPRGEVARRAQSRLLKPETLAELLNKCLAKIADPTVSRAIVPLLKRLGEQPVRELLALLENEPQAARRMRILQVVKLLGKNAAEALAEKLSDPQWFVVRNAVTAMAELGDAALLERMEPALTHSDERVQQAAVSAALKTRSPLRALPLARALPSLKPALMESVLDDLLVLKDAATVPYLETLIRLGSAPTLESGTPIRPAVLEKGLGVLAAIDNEDAVRALLNCAGDSRVPLPTRRAAVRSVAHMRLPAAHPALEEFARTAEPALAEDVGKLLGNAASGTGPA